MKTFKYSLLLFVSLAASVLAAEPARDAEAERVLKGVLDRLSGAESLVVEVGGGSLELEFRRSREVTMLRPYYYSIETVHGGKDEYRLMSKIADGRTVWRIEAGSYIVYKQPLHPVNFHYDTNPLIQYFFHPVIEFDPSDPTWGRSVSLFDTNKEAYNKSVTTRYLGEKAYVDGKLKMVEVKFNTATERIRQLFYVKDDLLIAVQTIFFSDDWGNEKSHMVRFNNYRFNTGIKPAQFAYTPPPKLPIQESDPVRLGEMAPDFELPLNTGQQVKMKELLKGKKGLLVVTLNGAAGMLRCKTPDQHLPQMRLMQDVKEKFQNQGLEVIAIVGGTYITPDVKDEMLRDWMPDTTRFSYPIAIDLDLERGIQGSAYQNFQLDGRNNILLDKEGRVVFACENFDTDRVNELALYQTLSQIGFAVSPADLEIKSAVRRGATR